MATLSNRMYVEKKTLAKWFVYSVFVMQFFFALCVELLRLPGVIRYLADAALICVVILALSKQSVSFDRRLLPFLLVVGIFLTYVFVSYLFLYQSAAYLLWGTRNNFRFYVAFFAFAVYFTEDDAKRCLKILDGLFWINALVCVVQAHMGFQQDYLGGIFGVTKGCNGYLVVFLSVTISKSVLCYMNGEEGMISCFAKCTVALMISAVGELKVFFIMFAVLLILAMLLTSFSFRKVLVIGVGAILITVMAALLGSMFHYFDGFLSMENLSKTLLMENYASETDIGRFNAIEVISRRFLPETADQLFGMGMGNCDVSSIAAFNTPFYDIYVDTHYSIFSYAHMFLETGFVGLTLFILFFVMCFIVSLKQMKKKNSNRFFCQMGVIISALCLILMVYNSSLRTEAGYMIYFVLALPFIRPRESLKEEDSGT